MVRRLCDGRGHDSTEACPLHRCAHCAVESFEYDVDPEDYEPPIDREDPRWDSLSDLAEAYLDTFEGCTICNEILRHSYWSDFPGAECEDTCTLAHCSECGRCGRSGDVCRRCATCKEHEESGGTSCWSTVWSRARRREVEFYEHDCWNPVTQRWGGA